MTDYIGTSGNDTLTGTSGDDTFDMSQGGKDTVNGGDGFNVYSFGATFAGGDHVIGGAGTDILKLEGDYSAGLTLNPNALVSVERIQFLGAFDYNLTLADGNIAPGEYLDFYTAPDVGADDRNVFVDASAVVSGGGITIYGGSASTIIGTQSHDQYLEFVSNFVADTQGGDDTILLYADLTRASQIDGGDGSDIVYAFGAVNGLIGHNELRHVETLLLFADADFRLSNQVVEAGQTLEIRNYAGASRIDGSAETSGHFYMVGGEGADTLIGGRAGDTLSGGGGDDVITGGKGGDILTGGDGADSFIFTKVGDSMRKAPDVITDFDSASDTIDLSAIDARTDRDGDQAFHLVGKFTHVAGQMTLSYFADNDTTTLSGDTNGDGKADLVIYISGEHTDVSGMVL